MVFWGCFRIGPEVLYTFGTLLAMTEAPGVIASDSAVISIEGMRLLRRYSPRNDRGWAGHRERERGDLDGRMRLLRRYSPRNDRGWRHGSGISLRDIVFLS